MRATSAILLSLLVLYFSPRLSRAVPAPQPAPPKYLDFIVVDAKTNRPLPDVKVDASFGNSNFNGQTSADGHALIKLPDAPARAVYVHVTKKNYVREYVQWVPQANGQPEPLPANFVVHLEPGSTITGRVVDDSGKPVGGAHVALIGRKNYPNPHEHLDSWRDDIVAKADGTWSFNEAPAQLDELQAGVWHQHYANGDYYALKPITPISLVKQPLTLVLKKGVPVEGTVLGLDGKPLAGAEVYFGGTMASNRIPPETTAADGRFAYAALPGDRVTLTVKAKSFAPELQQFTMPDQKQDVTIKLSAPKPFAGRVVGPDGKPIPFAWVYPDTWRGSRSLETRLHADKDGHFVWNEAPADTVYCDVDAPGFLRQSRVPLTAGDKEFTITLRHALHVHGTVVDAQTNKPIDVFTVVPGILFSTQQPLFWDRSRAKSAPRAGKIDYQETFSREGFAVRIEAPGYLPAESRTFKESEGDVALEFRLKPGKDFAAVVSQADGKPAAGATVYLVLPGETLQIHDGKSAAGMRSLQARTDANGAFSFPPQAGSVLLVVLNDYGYGQFTALPENGKLQIQPWSHVEGTVTMDGKPAANQYVNARPTEDGRFDRSRPGLIHLLDTQSDANGKFKFDRIPPGPTTISRAIRQATSGGGYMVSYADSEKITALPNQTMQVKLGGNGRTVTGHVTIPQPLVADRSWNWGMTNRATLKIDRPKLPLPDDMKDAPVEARRKWMTDFMKTDAGQTYQAEMRKVLEQNRSYPLELKPDGSFTIHNVAPGLYTLTITMARASGPSICGPGDNIATATTTFTVPPVDPKNLSPIELPPVAVEMTKTIQVGQQAPDFTAKTLDGETVHLADFKGKYLLLDFWASWCAPCVVESPSVKAAYEAFAKDDRFAMLAFSLDHAQTDAETFDKQNNITWPQAFLPNGFADPIVQAYAVHGVPSIWLISPEGKVLAKDLRGNAIQAAIRTAMGK